jgi:hypothetical protein
MTWERSVRRAVRGQTRTIGIGRSVHTAGAGSGTPVEVVDGAGAPRLEGLPYLKTTFRRRGFSKVLYTYSTLKIVVGRDWKEA